MKAPIVAAVLLVAGCAVATAPPGLPGLALVPAADGLDVDGSGGRQIGFGRDRAGALDSVARVTGRRPIPVACGGGRDAFDAGGGLILVFEGRSFVGWRTAGGAAGRQCP
ncbi:hypothetical protein [Jannaschia sp. LMIT008]|uniref:hypothetical protein n=1 Tax=Jannaschia maritima TaxID=3032585 RepID=UPI0028112CCA|nr:hypothetical protein [Jannaschia sp. LMIT008]